MRIRVQYTLLQLLNIKLYMCVSNLLQYIKINVVVDSRNSSRWEIYQLDYCSASMVFSLGNGTQQTGLVRPFPSHTVYTRYYKVWSIFLRWEKHQKTKTLYQNVYLSNFSKKELKKFGLRYQKCQTIKCFLLWAAD